MKILLTYICPPIPFRNFDWHATIDGREEEIINGFGSSWREAAEDLMEQLENEEI